MAAEDLSRFIGFDWDDGNRDKNWIKHRVSLPEREQAFFNRPLLLLEDSKHSTKERRSLLLGKTDAGRLLTVIFTVRGDKLRVISARAMHKKEQELYRHA